MFIHYHPLPKHFSLQLESLRGLSAIIVLFSHSFQAFIAPIDLSLYPQIRLLGQAAVMMFFVLSGFLIGHSIQKNIFFYEKFNIKHYCLQRCKRIIPPFIFSILLIWFFYFIAPLVFVSNSHAILGSGMLLRTEYAISQQDFIGTLFFLNGFLTNTVSANAALWSLSYEVWFYIIAACLVCYKHITACLIFVLLVIFLGGLNVQFLFYLCIWLLAFACSFSAITQNISAQQLQFTKIFFMILASLIAIWDSYQFHIIDKSMLYRANNFTSFNLCCGIALCSWLLQLRFHFYSFKPIWVHSARFSYTLYITHFPILVFILGCISTQHLQQPLFAVISLILSMLLCIIIAFGCSQFLEPQSNNQYQD